VGGETKIGVLALQGDVREHLQAVERIGLTAVAVRRAAELNGLGGLIIPGGESTTIGKLIERFSLAEPIRDLAAWSLPIMGTCAGMILLAKEIVGSSQFRLGLMDISVRRNAFGRQVDSFEADLSVPALGADPVRAVFIRAPYVESADHGVDVMAEFDGKTVMARQGNLLALAFHPELTMDTRVHEYFAQMVEGSGS